MSNLSPNKPAVFPRRNFGELVAALAEFPVAQSFSPLPVIVPSLPFRDQLQRAIADRAGVCMGYEFLTARTWIHRAIGPGDSSPWEPGRLVWRVFARAPDFEARLGIRDPSPKERFALAREVAGRLDQYMHYRPELPARWESGPDTPAGSGNTEGWQRELWLALRRETGVPPPPAELARLLNDPAARRRLAGEYPQLLVIGAGSFDPLLASLLRVLADAGSRVRVEALLPSLAYLEDLRAGSGLPGAATDLEEWESECPAHPLLESLGRASVSAFVLLGELDDQYSNWAAGFAEERRAATILERLQSSIQDGIAPVASGSRPADNSLGIHSCFGTMREVEAARDEILRAFAELPGLRPHEVRVAAPDPHAYAPLVAAVFEHRSPALPTAVSRFLSTGTNPHIDGILGLLRLAAAPRFCFSGVVGILRMEVMRERFEGADIEILRARLARSGFTHGEGREAPGAFGFALDRMVAGRWTGAGQEVKTARYPDKSFLLPVADELNADPVVMDPFLDWLASLREIIGSWKHPADASAWAERIESAAAALFSNPEDALMDLHPHLAFLRSVDCAGFLDAAALTDWLGERVGEIPPPGAPGAIGFGSLLQFQHLPCRVLVVLGMGDSNFPARDRPPSWDLLRASPKLHDRNPSIVDRQLFLDALLAPSERLVLLAPNRNPRTGVAEPFASCVDELLRALRIAGEPVNVFSHRLQPFSPDNFSGSSGICPPPVSFDHEALEICGRIHSPRAGGDPFCGTPLSVGTNGLTNIHAAEIVRMLKDPAGFFLCAAGIRLVAAREDETTLDRAPIELDALQAWAVRNEILSGRLGGRFDADYYRRLAQADRGLPPGALGEAGYLEQEVLAAPVADAFAHHNPEEMELEWVSRAGHRIFGKVSIAGDRTAVLFCGPGGWNHPRHGLGPWVSALLASACGHSLPAKIFAVGRGDEPVLCPAIPQTEAADLLESLVLIHGQAASAPLCYAPGTSHQIAMSLEEPEPDDSRAIDSARKKWLPAFVSDSSFPEGENPAAKLAWRGRDPFDPPGPWLELAARIAVPLKNWGGFS